MRKIDTYRALLREEGKHRKRCREEPALLKYSTFWSAFSYFCFAFSFSHGYAATALSRREPGIFVTFRTF